MRGIRAGVGQILLLLVPPAPLGQPHGHRAVKITGLVGRRAEVPSSATPELSDPEES